MAPTPPASTPPLALRPERLLAVAVAVLVLGGGGVALAVTHPWSPTARVRPAASPSPSPSAAFSASVFAGDWVPSSSGLEVRELVVAVTGNSLVYAVNVRGCLFNGPSLTAESTTVSSSFIGNFCGVGALNTLQLTAAGSSLQVTLNSTGEGAFSRRCRQGDVCSQRNIDFKNLAKTNPVFDQFKSQP